MKSLSKLHDSIGALRGVQFMLDAMFLADDAGTHKFNKEGIELLSSSCMRILEDLEEVNVEFERVDCLMGHMKREADLKSTL